MKNKDEKKAAKREEQLGPLARQLEAGQVLVCHALKKEITRPRLSKICQTIFQLAFLVNAQCYVKESNNEYLFLSVLRDGHSAGMFSRNLIQALLPEVRRVPVPPTRAEGFVPWGNVFDPELMVEISAAVDVYEDVQDPGTVELAATKNEKPYFFFPILDAEKHEDAYSIFAKLCERIVPPPEKRIYSISFVQDETYWVATVGKSLKGERRHLTPRREADKAEGSQQVRDPAVVLVIFEGPPCIVVTNGHRTQWANPFYVGSPTSIQYFAPLPTKARAARQF